MPIAYWYPASSLFHSQTVVSVNSEWSGLHITRLSLDIGICQRIPFYPQFIDTSFETSTWGRSLHFLSLHTLFKLFICRICQNYSQQ